LSARIEKLVSQGLPEALGGRVGLAVLGTQFQQGLVVLPDGWQTAFLERDEVLPMVILAGLEDGSLGIEPIQAQAQEQLGEVLLEPRGQTKERLQFAVLLGGPRIGVLDELGADRDRQPRGGDQLGLQDGMEVLRLVLHGPGEAVFTMPLAEVQLPGAVHDHQEVPQQPAVVQGLHADQSPDHRAAQAIQGRRGHVAQEVIEGVAVGQGLLVAAAEAIEVRQRLGAVQLEPRLPARAHLQQEHHQSHDQQEPPVIGDLVLVAGVGHLRQPGPMLRPEVSQGLPQRGPQR
jgi:hypothetical protein